MIFNTHTLQFWTASEGRGPYGTPQRTWTQFGPAVPGDVQHKRQTQVDIGPGVSGVGEWKVYTRPLDVAPDMVVQVVAGPNAGQTLKIEDAYNVRGSHVQLTCSAWKGTLDG